MKRKTSSIPTKIYSYGCLPPNEADLVIVNEQRKLAFEYYNWLIALELLRRKEYRKIQRREIPAMGILFDKEDQLNGKLSLLFEEVRGRRKNVRKRIPIPEDLQKKITQTKKQLKKVRDDLSEHRKTFTKQFVTPVKKQIDERKKKIVKQEEDRRKKAGLPTLIGPHDLAKFNQRVRDQFKDELGDTVGWEIDLLDRKFQNIHKQFRRGIGPKGCGLGTGTYVLVEKAVDAACGRKGGEKKKKKKQGDPQLHRHQDRFRIGVQVRCTAMQLFSGYSRAQIDPLPPETWDTGRGRRKAHTVARLSAGGRLISFPTKLHRPIPEDAKIADFWVLGLRIGTRTKYRLQVTIESKSAGQRKVMGTGTCAINFGWRKIGENEYRVGYVVDSSGGEQQIVISPGSSPGKFGIWEALTYPDSLRRVNDDKLNEVKEELAKSRDVMPDWVRKATQHIFSGRKLSRVAFHWAREETTQAAIEKLWAKWKKLRIAKLPLNSPEKQKLFPTFEELDPWLKKQGVKATSTRVALYLEWWRRFNRKMYQWESEHRERAINRRNDFYRCEANRLAGIYETLIVDDTDYSQLQERPADDEKDDSWDEARFQRKTLAVATLRSSCIQAFCSDTVKVEAQDNSRICSDCGSQMPNTEKIHVTCPNCNVTHDVDRNNCINMLRRASTAKAAE